MRRLLTMINQKLFLLELPGEVLTGIVETTPLSDLKNFSLACKKLHKIAIKDLFYRFVLVPHKSSLARFQELPNQRIAQSVEHLVFDAR